VNGRTEICAKNWLSTNRPIFAAADQVDQWTRRVTGSTRCRSVQFQFVCCEGGLPNESAPIQLALQYWFPGLAISSVKISIYTFSNKIYGSNVTKQDSETVMAWNYRNADCSLRKKIIVSFIIIFGTFSFPVDTYVRVFSSWKCLGYERARTIVLWGRVRATRRPISVAFSVSAQMTSRIVTYPCCKGKK